MGWWKCLQAWAALRRDDHRGIRPRDLVVSEGSLRGELLRSKTTGCDKMVKSRPIIITPLAYVHDAGWLLAGWKLLRDLCASPRDFLLPTPTCGAKSAALAPLTHRDATTLSLYLMSHLRRPDHEGLPLLHACTASGYWRQHSGRAFLTTAASCLGFSTADLDLLGGWRAQGGAAYVRRVRGKVSQIQSLVRGVIARGEVHWALEAEALQDLSTWCNRGVSEAEIGEQVEALGVHPANDSPAALPLGRLQEASTSQEHSSVKELTDFEVETGADSHGNQSLGESVDAHEDEELAPACEVLCGGLPSRTVPDSILPYLSETALYEFLKLPLREQRRRLLQSLPAGFKTCYDRVKRTKRLHRLRGCYRIPLVDYMGTEYLGEAVPAEELYTCICRRCFSSGAPRAQVIEIGSSVSSTTSRGNEESCGERFCSER